MLLEPNAPEIKRLNGDEDDRRRGIDTVHRLAVAWRLNLDEILRGASNSIVVGGTDAEEFEIVLRVPLYRDGLESGYGAQIAFSGRGGVSVLRREDFSGAILMPRLRPGKMLHEAGLAAEQEAKVCAGLIRSMRSSPIPEAIILESWYEPFLGVEEAENIDRELLRTAQRWAERLLESTHDRVLLHADLHHYNILRDGKGWVAIDAQGVSGDPAVEGAAFLRNPCYSLEPTPDLMQRRIRTLSEELGLSAARIRDWGVAHNVLSAWWDPAGNRSRTIAAVQAIAAAEI